MSNYFLNQEILNRIANGNTVTLRNTDAEVEQEVCYCDKCGWPVDTEYEKEIGVHVECKST